MDEQTIGAEAQRWSLKRAVLPRAARAERIAIVERERILCPARNLFEKGFLTSKIFGKGGGKVCSGAHRIPRCLPLKKDRERKA
jgi:hypothetical protein